MRENNVFRVLSKLFHYKDRIIYTAALCWKKKLNRNYRTKGPILRRRVNALRINFHEISFAKPWQITFILPPSSGVELSLACDI